METIKHSLPSLFVLCFFIIVSAQTSGSPAPQEIRVMMTRAGESPSEFHVKAPWYSASLEHYYLFRFDPVPKCILIPIGKVSKTLYGKDSYGIILPTDDLLKASNKLKADYLVKHGYVENKLSNELNYFVEIYKPEDGSLIKKIDAKLQLNDIEKSLNECFSEIITVMNITVPGNIKQALIQPVLGSKPVDGIVSFGKLIEKDPSISKEKTIKKLEALVKKDKTFALPAFTLANTCNTRNEFDKASFFYNQLIMENGFCYPSIYINASKNYRLYKSFDNAKKILDHAGEKGFNTFNIQLERARILEQSGKLTEAKNLYNKLLAKYPDQLEALLFLAQQHRKAGLFDDALELVNRIIDQDISSYKGLAYIEKIENLIALKNYQEARETLQIAKNNVDDNPRIILLSGEIFFNEGDYRNAAQFYIQALENEPNNLSLLLKTAESLVKANNSREAVNILEKYQTNFSSTDAIKINMRIQRLESRF